jgi:23S rRNA (guanine2535-N1)-methyltransferase
MPYKFATQQTDHSDLASGRVLYSLPGHPAFPVRLAGEIFQRCLARRAAAGQTQPVTLYDPCCGGAYHLSALAYGHWHAIQAIVASDVDAQAVQLAARNLGLLTPDGLEKRIQELRASYDEYGKESHRAALQSAETLHEEVVTLAGQHPIRTLAFQASAFDTPALMAHLRETRVDVVLTDIPYGLQSAWHLDNPEQAQNPAGAMLRALREFLHAGSIVAVAADKQQKIADDGYDRVERFQIGKRQVVLLKPRR